MPRLLALVIGCSAISLLSSIAVAAPATPPGPNQDVSDLIEAGRYGEAETLARSRLAEVEARDGPDSTAAADVLDLLVESLWQAEKLKDGEAKALAERAIRIREATPGGQVGDLARSVKQLGTLLNQAGDLAGARPVLERSVALYEQAFGPDDIRVGKTLVNLAVVHARSGDYPGARPLFERSLAIARAALPPGDADLGYSLINLASLDYVMGDYDAARPLYEETLAIWEKAYGPDHPRMGNVLVNLANLDAVTGDIAAALPLYARAVAVQRAAHGADSPQLARVLVAYAEVLRRAGDLATARKMLEETRAIYERAGKGDDPQMVPVLQNLGLVLDDLHDSATARTLLDQALALQAKVLGTEHPGRVVLLINHGGVLEDLGDLEGARLDYDVAADLAARVLQSGDPALGLLEHARGVNDVRRGDRESASIAFQAALAIRRERLGARHPEVADTLTQIARLAWAGGARGPALGAAEEAAAIIDGFVSETVGVLPEARALALASSRPHPEDVLFAALLDAPDLRGAALAACWTWTLRHRAIVLEEMSERRATVDAAADPAARAAWDRLARARDRLAAAWFRGLGGDVDATVLADLATARAAEEQAETALAGESARFRRLRGFAAVTPVQAAEALPRDGVLIEIVRVPVRSREGLEGVEPGPVRYVALGLTPSGTMSYADLGDAGAVEALVAAWRGALSEAAGGDARAARLTPDVEATGRRLADKVWRPLEPLIGSAHQIFLVPDGALHEVYFPALPAGDGRFLIENGPRISTLSTGRDLVRLQATPARVVPTGGLLALGDPAFAGAAQATEGARAAALPCPSAVAVALTPLPESGREVQRIAALFAGRGPATVLIGPDASERRFKNEAPGRGVLHLATHGFFLGESCADTPAGATSPLLLSGLALAGTGTSGGDAAANSGVRAAATTRAGAGTGDPGDDGFLTAEEIAGLDLAAAGLTFLSGCDTGRGTITAGEGVFGLQRALEIAGSRTVVMSLWEVPDRQARRWSEAFYRDWLSGTPVDEAARSASRELLDDLRRRGRPPHPYLWGGFLAVGDWKAMGHPRGVAPPAGPT